MRGRSAALAARDLGTIVITGATSGIGEATAHRFAEEGAVRIVITGRRMDRLDALKAQFQQLYPDVAILPLALDMQDIRALYAIEDMLPGEFRDVGVLVNNAGCALGLGQVDTATAEDVQNMIATNVLGLITLTGVLSKGMRQRKRGHILSVGSISSYNTYSGGSAYCATKYAVRGYMQGIRSDLRDTPIRVSMVSPGFVETEFSLVRFHGDSKRAEHVYDDFVPLYAPDVADSIFYIATRPAHVQISEVIVWPTNQSEGGPAVSRVGPSLGAEPTEA